SLASASTSSGASPSSSVGSSPRVPASTFLRRVVFFLAVFLPSPSALAVFLLLVFFLAAIVRVPAHDRQTPGPAASPLLRFGIPGMAWFYRRTRSGRRWRRGCLR